MIGEVHYWFQGDADMVVVDERPDDLKVAVVGREPRHPLLGIVWIKEWQFRGQPA